MTARNTRAMLLALVVLVAGALPAAAAKPVMTDHYSFGFTEMDPFLTEACGLDVTVDVQVEGKFTMRADGSFSDHVQERVVYRTSAATIHQFGSRNFKGPAETVTERPDGSTTIEFEDFERGLSIRLKDANGVIVRDAGNITFDVTITIDPDGEEIFSVEADVKGPHPIFDDPDAVGSLCSLLNGGAF